MNSKPPDALRDALARVILDMRREWQRELEASAAQSRAVIAELRAGVTEITARCDERINEAIGKIKDGAPGEKGEPGRDGQSVSDEDIKAAVDAAIGQASEGLRAEVSERIDVALRSYNGEVESRVVEIERRLSAAVANVRDGRDGQPGRDGKDGERGLPGLDGKDGRDGINGKDGLGFDDMTEELAEDGRTLVRRYVRGDEVKEFRHTLGIVLDRGGWKEGHFEPGDGVTWGGSFWIAQCATKAKPDTNGDWRLAVRRGRDGKDGKNGKDGERGPEGKAGRDGGKW